MKLLLSLAALAATLAACSTPAPSPSTPRPSTAGPGVHVLAQRLAMPGLGRERTLRLYLPPSYETSPDARYPVIYMHDAQNLFDDATSFAGEWGVDETLDAFARTRGLEAIVVGIDNGGADRNHELSPWSNPKIDPAQGAQYMAFVVDVVKPFVDAHYRTRPDRANTAMIGSSLGGLVTHYALLRYPQVFGKAAIFSPSYWISNEAYTQTAAHPWPADTRVYFYIGGKEGDESVPDLERMIPLLATPDHAVRGITLHIEPDARHDEKAWRAEFPRAIAWLFEVRPLDAKMAP
ncbi:alpha/beta hydrolase [Scleromatobacter humisilvae]|uniref:Alpha/beta hydrolase n=1 Tax=Scleromatobacter humisilvae TaxID=2897159 RepID=A0A9X1YME3_9BURK|nr:alpha/beta hydrolase-fold protein [Scleromatobacter humisilvae]MCK9687448.1 alpha/beta hydrolase [Scleromatobacter humisilvae]